MSKPNLGSFKMIMMSYELNIITFRMHTLSDQNYINGRAESG